MHHSYRRLVLDALPDSDAQGTRASLASMMGLLQHREGQWLNPQGIVIDLDSYLREIDPLLRAGTLIRQLETNLFDADKLLYHKRSELMTEPDKPLSFLLKKRQLPDPLPLSWQLSHAGQDMVRVEIQGSLTVLTENYHSASVKSAGQLPSGFDPEKRYASRNHPRGLQLSILGASDAIQSLGLDWEQVLAQLSPDQISVYAGSSMSQMDYNGNGGMLQARLLGKKVSSKQLPLGFAEMPADFINAYVLGNLGSTGTNVAACATFLYNLRQGIRDIRAGTHRLCIVGTSEAPITPEVMDGYATMGALADDQTLLALDKGRTTPDYRRACRPFGENAGFTLAESAQFIVLCDDTLALEMGASIYGAVNDVFVNADGYKKSIASPGVGNYITLAKAVAATRNLIGETGLQQRSYVQAHGTGTPQNRTTESHILSEVARTWGISHWPVAALKSYIGHSLASASADQLVCSLGTWRYGIIPGILTIDAIADDVHQQNLDILLQHKQVGPQGMDAVLINAKGFGGNNATASVLAPHIAEKMLGTRHGKKAMRAYQQRNEAVRENSAEYDAAMIKGQVDPIYRFDHNVLGSDSLQMDQLSLKLASHQHAIDLQVENPYLEYL